MVSSTHLFCDLPGPAHSAVMETLMGRKPGDYVALCGGFMCNVNHFTG